MGIPCYSDSKIVINDTYRRFPWKISERPEWPAVAPNPLFHKALEASDGDDGFSMNYLSINKSLWEAGSEKHNFKLEADGRR